MKGKQLEMLCLEQMVKDQRIPPFALEQHREIPLQLISLYNYGELIHFGERREKLKEVIGAGPFEENWTKMEFMIAAAGLSHFYIGFGLLIQAALAD